MSRFIAEVFLAAPILRGYGIIKTACVSRFSNLLMMALLSSAPLANAEWVEYRTAQGCIYNMWESSDGGFTVDRIEWGASCVPGEPITGQGTLRLWQTQSDGDKTWVDYTANFVNGSEDGDVRAVTSWLPENVNTYSAVAGCWMGETDDGCTPKPVKPKVVARSNGVHRWHEYRTDRGCLVYMWSETRVWEKVTWSGSCATGVPVEGVGTVRFSRDGREIAISGNYSGGVGSGPMRLESPDIDGFLEENLTDGCSPGVTDGCVPGTAPGQVNKGLAVAPTASAPVDASSDNCLEQAKAIQLQSAAEGRQAGSDLGKIQDAEIRSLVSLRELFQTTCANYPGALTWVAASNVKLYQIDAARGEQAVPASMSEGAGSGSTSAAAAASSARSKKIAGDGRSAMGCVKLETIASGESGMSQGGRILKNNCGETVELSWCYVDSECGKGIGNSWSVGAGRSWPVSATREIRWGACYGANTIGAVEGTAGTRYHCSAPLR